LHWDVHGPWDTESREYWDNDDALFRSEVGVPGASSAEITRKYSGGLPELPANLDNPLWRRTAWWIQWDSFLKEKGCEPPSLEEFVEWSQKRQADGLALAVLSCKRRFPKCGGIIIWMGHDCFPCTANTSIFDFEGKSKPAVLEITEVFRK
jgi:beta-mannosidase